MARYVCVGFLTFIALVLLLDLFATRVRTRKRSSIVRHDVSTTTSPP